MSALPPSRRGSPRPHLYLAIFGAWGAALLWFHPRLAALLELATGPLSWAVLGFFIVFTEFAWLYGFYNLGIVLFAARYRRRARGAARLSGLPELAGPPPAVALLYTTCNDFVEASAESCVRQAYEAFTVYLLDDSTDAAYCARVDAFAARHPEQVRVVRRVDRRGFKAGNLNHALAHAATAEPLFALVDADEVLPPDFLRRMVPHLLASEDRGFVQANHRCAPVPTGSLGDAVGVGIDIHWRWYQPLRNEYGFVMLLGHGALLRRACWEAVGGFPEIVSEDLAFALRAREQGWRGYFVEDVVCWEDFPSDVRAFRVRHMKWTRGTCELLAREMGRALRSRRISLVEKLDVLFPTLSLPLSLLYFLYIVDANLGIAALFGERRALTITLGARALVLPTWGLDERFASIMTPDFFLITLLTFLAPVLCFVIELARRPGVLFRFLCRSSTVYAALGPMSCVGVVSYLATGKARFLVTGERRSRPSGGGVLGVSRVRVSGASTAASSGASSGATSGARARARLARLRASWQRLLAASHPDHPAVQGFEVACGVIFGLACLALAQLSFLGLAVAFVLLPLLHNVPWEHPVMRWLVYVPFVLIVSGIALGGLALLGVQPVFFGYGFHF